MKLMKKILAAVIGIVLVVTGLPIYAVDSDLPFNDVNEDQWFHAAVEYAYSKGIMNGVGTNSFGPDITVNRGMIVTVIHRMEGEPDLGDSDFSDVPAGAYYSKAIAWARATGIVNGLNDTAFGPEEKLTRQQLATILYRYAGYKGENTEMRGDLSAFTDSSQISPYAEDAMSWAYVKELVSGIGNSLLAPEGDATRAQFAQIMMRYADMTAPKKYFTLSFDDGITQDLKIIEILEKYDMDCITFNINTGLYGASWDWVADACGTPGLSHLRFTEEELRSGIYDGYDVAVHTKTHRSLSLFDNDPATMFDEVAGDALNIESITGIAPVGMAWPGGEGQYTEKTIELILQLTDIRYARGTGNTFSYRLPEYFMQWQPTCSLMDKYLLLYADTFARAKAEEDMLFYVWGHGYELDAYGLYDEFEALVKRMSQCEDVVFVTNTEFYELYKNKIPSWK